MVLYRYWALQLRPDETVYSDSQVYQHIINKGHLRPHNQPLHTRTLFSFQGNGEETFTTGVTSDSLYFLDIASLESDTSFQVFVWDHKNQGNLWPQLPNDSQLEITSAEEDRIKLSWKPSLGDGKKINYCVFVNKQHNVKTWCATESNINKMFSNQLKENEGKSSKSLDPAMKTSKIHSNNLKENVMEQKINHDQLSSKNFVGAQKVCVGHWTNATISKLKPKTLYYFDVFAVNSHTGTSLAYTGTFAETKNKHRSQLVNLQITVKEEVIISQNIHRAHNFKISGKPKASCIITLKSSKGGPGLVKILATTAHNHLPFPNLSSDNSFSVHNSTCSSATVTWTGSGHGTKYCIYARHLEQNLDLKLIHKHQNSCLSTNSRSKSKGILFKVEKIKDLKPGKTYLLDLYFIGLHNSTIKFPSRVVRTQGWCS
uniref:Protein NDNF n=1 Tax=Xenopus tropicalis TaxID=8364 RepID=A0A6I8T1A4_XENTR